MSSFISRIKKWFRRQYTRQAVSIFILINIIIFLANRGYSKIFGEGMPLSFNSSSVTNFFFALIAIVGIGFGLSFSFYEIDELKEYRAKIANSKEFSNSLKDMLGVDINLKIESAKPITLSAVKFYLWMTLVLSMGIIINELLSSYSNKACLNILRFLKIEAIVMLFVVIWHLFGIFRYKQYLLTLCILEYDRSIKKISDISGGDYRSLLPPE